MTVDPSLADRVNSFGGESHDRVRRANGAGHDCFAVHDRFAALTTAHDPQNVLRVNQNVRPAE